MTVGVGIGVFPSELSVGLSRAAVLQSVPQLSLHKIPSYSLTASSSSSTTRFSWSTPMSLRFFQAVPE
ncbi:hypothetical protein K1719_044223 [Acacia pycnantha]|nr:hypothetical protein K1719_044223 [Acacia pycnantha]